MKFRIKHVPNIGYFPQVKRWWGQWETVVVAHDQEVILCQSSYTGYPSDSYDEARAACLHYMKDGGASYEYFHLNQKDLTS